jgi:hypothetical protein
MKKITFIFILFLSACNGTTNEAGVSKKTINYKQLIAITGQSNARDCDWSYIENENVETENLAIGGTTIQELIDHHLGWDDFDSIIFIHGENDAMLKTDPMLYVDKVEEYRLMFGDIPIYISLVGNDSYHRNGNHDEIRGSVINESIANPMWFVMFEDAQYFHKQGLMKDHVHYSIEGCELVMNHFLILP